MAIREVAPERTAMSKTRSNDALAAFIGRKTEIDTLLERLKVHSDDHFGVAPDDVNWGHVGMLTECASLLRRAAEFVVSGQESKSSK
jgi:hypothetical protein